jgi:hypothetical protein
MIEKRRHSHIVVKMVGGTGHRAAHAAQIK